MPWANYQLLGLRGPHAQIGMDIDHLRVELVESNEDVESRQDLIEACLETWQERFNLDLQRCIVTKRRIDGCNAILFENPDSRKT